MGTDWRFLAPTQAETESKLSAEQLANCQKLAMELVADYGPVPGDFYLPGWVWGQLSLAQHCGIDDAMLITRALDQSYQELQERLSDDANQQA